MRTSMGSLEQIRRALRSTNQGERVGAMQWLLQQARKDPGIHGDALPLFQAAITDEPDASTAIYAARGVAVVAGPEAARTAWLSLLDRPDANTVAQVAYAIDDPSYVSDVLRLLERRPELPVRHAIIRALGRSKDPSVLPVIVEGLAVPELRPDVVQALSELGDPQAIPHLQTLLGDTTNAWEEDNHGPMLRVCDLAAGAIRGLGGVSSGARDDGRSVSLTYAPIERTPTRRSGVVGNAFMAIGGIVMSLGGVWLTFSGKSKEDRLAGIVGAILFGLCAGSGIKDLTARVRQADGGLPSWWLRLTPYIPLAAAIAEVPWLVVCVMMLLFLVGDSRLTSTPEKERLFAAAVALPSMLGLLCGIVILFTGAVRTVAQLICFVIGCILCATVVFAMVMGWIR